ncbi:hypothetical protein VFPPC_11576 [Pochonia chlamydosporia 170]|uniref:Uncharacterized protein n=1 Tax=Pochonia chlamydosporia 170 TaxID=1380566 RepID=A0A179EZ33_METCM|nr:hypothetical protein VFPPC_11576 [Pochonia chlamydosporia 170]OAQ58446.1 hypothetical protein VFPPC_11576 [Pochonia chlamydosporia 170]
MQNELSGKHEVPWREGVHCQRFFPTRCASGWFEVGRKAIPQKKLRFDDKGGCKSQQATRQRRHTVATEVALQEHLEAALGRHQQHLDAQQQARICAKKMGNGSLAVMSPWLERTQWRRIYKNVRRDLLKAMVRLPLRHPKSRQWAALKLGQGVADGDADFVSSQISEERIACVMKAVDLVINRCERTVLQTSRLIRCWIVTSRTMNYNSRSFEVMTERSTRRRYRDSWKKFIAFLIRSHHLPTEAKQETGILIPNEIVQLLLQLVQHQIWGMFDASEGQWPPVEDHRYANTDEVSSNFSIGLQELEVRARPETLYCTDATDGSSCPSQSSDFDDSESDMNSFSTISDEDSGLENYARTNTANRDRTVDPPNGVKNDQDKDRLEMASIDFLERLFELSVAVCKQEVRGGPPGSTVLLYFSGIFGFSSDCQQFKLGRDFCPSLSGLIYVQRLLLLESALPLTAYPSLSIPQRPVDGQLEMIQRLCNGETVVYSAEIKDDLTNRDVGYSFVKHEENGFQTATKELLAQLSKPHGHLPSLMTHKSWQWKAVKHYLGMVTRLRSLIFGGKYTSGGQTPRLRELQWLLRENTAWASRGVYVWNGSVVYIIKHHKAKRMTNKEFYVVRFLPLRLGLVVIKYLAFIHPVAEVLRRELHEHMQISEPWQPTHLLFGKNEKPWATSKCTSIIQTAAHAVCKQKITSQMYRQIGIGITEKKVREVYTPFNQYDEKCPAADKNVVFAMQSGHKVIQRNATYGLDGAYLLPSLLRIYEWASTRWHEFLHQAIKVKK